MLPREAAGVGSRGTVSGPKELTAAGRAAPGWQPEEQSDSSPGTGGQHPPKMCLLGASCRWELPRRSHI